MLPDSIWTKPGTRVGAAEFIVGGLSCVKGLRCAGVHAGFKLNSERLDFALMVAERPAVAAGLFTQSRFAAAPVLLSRQHLAFVRRTDRPSASLGQAADNQAAAGQGARAIIINSAKANASTGKAGRALAAESAALVATALGCLPQQVLVASTGVIGQALGLESFQRGIERGLAVLGPADGSDLASGHAAAEAIMTTDTYPKEAAVRVTVADAATATVPNGGGVAAGSYTIAGMVKGSGMIQPQMATMLGVFATDACLSQAAADLAFKQAIDQSLNRVTVDSDTSTNDSAFFLATGAAEVGIEVGTEAFKVFVQSLCTLTVELARMLAADGEGASKLVTVSVSGAVDQADADRAARSVANSPLVKTAIAGHDANWGRIAMALGKSGAEFDQEQVSISILGLQVLERGLPVPFDEAEALRRFDVFDEVEIQVDLGCPGQGSAVIWTCDLTHQYISINGDYRS
ncbi:MAG: bifunctional glutamate N-acetyltransferase/amino-acid acetyltransferase ArgJ [Actinomycetia bacterium]|nr:bifunctional glutamate N-acetyltransferase/amino-acid acetyltransferase ArgJ [Actinomycetes bacterium]